MDRADRREKQVALVSQQILEAAARAITSQGFGATTMAHIGTPATAFSVGGCSPGGARHRCSWSQ